MPGPVRFPRRLEARLDARGRLTLPREIRRMLGLGPGQKLLFRVEEGEIRAVTPQALLLPQRRARLALQARRDAPKSPAP
jgi:AbrB family looped-hinge helix DNA binding protein